MSACREGNQHTKELKGMSDTALREGVVGSSSAATAVHQLSVDALNQLSVEMLEGIEHLGRAMITDDEDRTRQECLDEAQERRDAIHAAEVVAQIATEEESGRYVIAASENCAWCIAIDEWWETSKSIITTAQAAVGAAAVPTETVPNSNWGTRDAVTDPQSPQQPVADDETGLQPPNQDEAPSNEISEELLAVVERFVTEDRQRVEEEEAELRDVLSVEMELDRGELISIASQAAQHKQHHSEHDELPAAPTATSSGIVAIECELHHMGRDGAHVHDHYRHRSFQEGLVPMELWGMSLNEEACFTVSSAEAYERLDIEKRWGYWMRYLSPMSRDPAQLDAFLGSTTCDDLLHHQVLAVPAPPPPPAVAVPPPVLPDMSSLGFLGSSPRGYVPPMSRIGEWWTSQLQQQASASRGASDVRDDIVGPGATSSDEVFVPDASQLQKHDAAQNQPESPSVGEGDPLIEQLTHELRCHANKAEIQSLLYACVDEEVVERELLYQLTMEERRRFVDHFAACVVEEYDWSLGGYRYRLRPNRKNPMSQVASPVVSYCTPESKSSRVDIEHHAATMPSRLCNKDRHLPRHMRTPAPRHEPSPGGRLTTVAISPSPPSMAPSRVSAKSRQSGYFADTASDVSRSSQVSRLADLLVLTAHRSPAAGGLTTLTPAPPLSRPLLHPVGGFQ